LLVSKNWDIDLIASQNRTVLNFLALYSFLCIVIIATVSILYYNFQKDLMLQQNRATLQEYSDHLINALRNLHINFDKERTYPRFEQFESAIYDSAYKEIFTTFDSSNIDLNKVLYHSNERIYFINQPESYYLGSKYIVVSVKDSKKWLSSVYRNIAFFSATALIFLLGVGYFLLALLLKPMKNALFLLDRFIKDTTHELNTPVSAILSNIEMIDKTNLDPKLIKKINRIDTGAKTISNIYQDLTYLTLNHQIISKDEWIDLQALLNERIEYFKTMIEVKNITVHSKLQKTLIFIDRSKCIKLIDNIFSNAIKYNKNGGTIEVILEKNSLQIIDSGIGIKKDKIDKIFGRYKRFDSSVGGFGIGLSIVAMIVKEYDLQIQIDSKEKIGTKVTISWQS